MAKDVDDYLLTSTVTVGQCKHWMGVKDGKAKEQIIDLVYHRFHNRYIKHIGNARAGFLKMAVGCLMIETLESFKLGVLDTKGRSKAMFDSFFETEETHFPDFKNFKTFYKDIRCGILHQAETTNGWRILLYGQLLNEEERTINAEKFMQSLQAALNNYKEELVTKDFTSVIWKNTLAKLEDICANCVASDPI